MARRRTKSREIDPANRSAKHPCKTAIQLLPHGSTKRSIKRAIPHNAAGNSGMTGNTDIPRCCPFGSGSRASVSRVWRVAARAHRTHTTVIHSSNRTERISASPFRRTCTYTVCISTRACVLTHQPLCAEFGRKRLPGEAGYGVQHSRSPVGSQAP